MTVSLVLCEGYHDRAFWAGWLLYLGCSDKSLQPGQSGRLPVYYPWGDKLSRGEYGYEAPSGDLLAVVPCQGKDNLLPTARIRLAARTAKPLRRLVLTVDPDVLVGPPASGATGLKQQDVLHFLQAIDPAAVTNANGEIEIDGGATKVALIRWEVSDPPIPGLPQQQTLERLVCAAITAAYPARAQAVQSWLDSRPELPPTNPKEHAWSYMAGWYAEHGCENFYTNLWKDRLLVNALESRLRAGGAWQIVETLAH